MAGSKALLKALETTVDSQNMSFLDAAKYAGYAQDPVDLTSVFLKKGAYAGFVELHIEQGPILEEEGWVPFVRSGQSLDYRTSSVYSAFFVPQVYLLA